MWRPTVGWAGGARRRARCSRCARFRSRKPPALAKRYEQLSLTQGSTYIPSPWLPVSCLVSWGRLQQEQRRAAAAAATTSATQAVPRPQWAAGTASPATSARPKSLLEIQMEEQAAAARQQQQQVQAASRYAQMASQPPAPTSAPATSQPTSWAALARPAPGTVVARPPAAAAAARPAQPAVTVPRSATAPSQPIKAPTAGPYDARLLELGCLSKMTHIS